MRFLKTLSTITLMSLSVTVYAEEGEAIAHDLTELRQQIGEPGSPLQAEATDFQQAVREVARDERRQGRSFGNGRTFDVPSFGTPTARRTTPSPPGYSPHSYHAFSANRSWGDPAHHDRRAPTPASRLRETAFELDRLAHELEMAELYDGADTLRDTAEKLRQSARQVVANPGQDGTGVALPSPARKSRPK